MRRSIRWPKAPKGLGNAAQADGWANLRAAGVELLCLPQRCAGERIFFVLPMLFRSEKIVSDRQ